MMMNIKVLHSGMLHHVVLYRSASVLEECAQGLRVCQACTQAPLLLAYFLTLKMEKVHTSKMTVPQTIYGIISQYMALFLFIEFYGSNK
jgi:hypothetical protein